MSPPSYIKYLLLTPHVESLQLEKTTWPPSRRLAQQGSGGCQRPTAMYAVEIWDR